MSWKPPPEFDYVKSMTLNQRAEEVALARRNFGLDNVNVVVKYRGESRPDGVDPARLATEIVLHLPYTTRLLRVRQTVRHHLRLGEFDPIYLVLHPNVYYDKDDYLGFLHGVFSSEDGHLYIRYTFEEPRLA